MPCEAIPSNRNLAVPLYLIHCYLYYVLDDPVLSDADFDVLVGFLQDEWVRINHHHKHLLDPELLKSGFHIQYPAIVAGAARAYLEELRGPARARRRRRLR